MRLDSPIQVAARLAWPLLLTTMVGCQGAEQATPPMLAGVPTSGEPAPASQAEPSPGITASPGPASAASTAAAVRLIGRAALAGGGFAGAAVEARRPGKVKVLARGTTDAVGAFDLELLPGTVPGEPLVVRATRDDAALVALIAAPRGATAFRLNAAPEASLTLATTIAMLLLGPRLEAAGRAGGTSAILASYERLAGEVSKQLPREVPADFRAAVLAAARKGTAAAAFAADPAALALLGPTLGPVVAEAAKELDEALLDAVAKGGTKPSEDAIAPIAFGGLRVDPPDLARGQTGAATLTGGSAGGGSAGGGSGGGGSGGGGSSGGGTPQPTPTDEIGLTGNLDPAASDREPGEIGLTGNLDPAAPATP